MATDIERLHCCSCCVSYRTHQQTIQQQHCSSCCVLHPNRRRCRRPKNGLKEDDEMSPAAAFETLTFEFFDFPSLTQYDSEGSGSIEGDNEDAKWFSGFLEMNPRGDGGWFSINLYCQDAVPPPLHIDHSISPFCQNLSKQPRKHSNTVQLSGIVQIGPRIYQTFQHTFDENCNYTWKSGKIAKFYNIRDDCLEADGRLLIRLHLRVDKTRDSTWFPKALEANKVLAPMLKSSLHSDVSFSVGSNQQRFHAHKCVLIHRAPILYDIVKDVERGNAIEIPKVTGLAFQHLLDHIYTNSLPQLSNDDKQAAKELLLVSDLYGCTQLKLYVEARITYYMLTIDNAADWLLMADGHACPLLKEACMDKYVENMSQMKASVGWQKVRESKLLLEDILEHVTSKLTYRNNNDASDAENYEIMSVGKLREKLELSGLDLDGTKTMLIRRLKDNTCCSTSTSTINGGRRPTN